MFLNNTYTYYGKKELWKEKNHQDHDEPPEKPDAQGSAEAILIYSKNQARHLRTSDFQGKISERLQKSTVLIPT